MLRIQTLSFRIPPSQASHRRDCLPSTVLYKEKARSKAGFFALQEDQFPALRDSLTRSFAFRMRLRRRMK